MAIQSKRQKPSPQWSLNDELLLRDEIELLRRRKAQSHLLHFTEYTFPRYSVGNPHRIIADALDRVLSDGDDKIDRLMLCLPPRHGKSELASRRFPAFALGTHPEWLVISASAEQSLADGFGRDVRNIVGMPEYQTLFKTRLAEDQQARGNWRTDAGGGYYAVGVNGGLMGRGGHLIVIDDPYSNWAAGQSEIKRKEVWDWYTSTVYNRQMPGARIIVINHRMHEADLCGQLLEAEKNGGDKWHVINLPAIKDGVALWPEMYPLPVLERMKSVMSISNRVAWDALYQQDPTPDDGIFLKKEWFIRYTERPASLNIYISGDFAVTPGGNDYTSLIVWGVDHHGFVYALARWSKQASSDEWTVQLVKMIKDWKPIAFIGEAGVIKSAVEPFLRDALNRANVFTVLEWLPTVGQGNKAARAQSFAGLQSSGRIYWPHLDWADDVIKQCLKFPGGANDDDVDACGLFGRYIADVWAATPPASQPPAPNWDAPLMLSDIYKRKRA